MTALRRRLYLASVAIHLLSVALPALAEPHIEVSFEPEASGDRLIRAQALFPVDSPVIQSIFTAIPEYPSLHDWIEETQRVGGDLHSQDYLVKFRFPWPVGRQWSRVRVWHEGKKGIHWRQVEGSLQANRGDISFSTRNGRAHIDYRAVIDVGLPDLLTQPYKKKFVTEFLGAVHDRALKPGLRLATTAQP
ncbi:MAG: hypothetical protein PVI91_02140 [Gammaproteobacteria bacterium]|jgi:hypothetical protein